MPTAEATSTKPIRIYLPVLLCWLCYGLIHWFVALRPPGPLGLMLYYLGSFFLGIPLLIHLLVRLVKMMLRKNKRTLPFVASGLLSLGLFGLMAYRIDQGGLLFSAFPSPHDVHPSEVAFRLPLTDTLTVAWGGGEVEANYHVSAPDQRWAYDLLITRKGKSFSGDSTRLESYFCYGKPLLAPASGMVTEVFDRDPDMKPGELGGGTDPGGNQIILQVAKNQYLFLCHLKHGSILVKRGDYIRAGQVLASVGNSGNTSEPHLHIHLQDTPDLGFGNGIPLRFHQYLSNGKKVEMGIPKGGIDEKGNCIGERVITMFP